jgi:thiopurine S-methyltransferase
MHAEFWHKRWKNNEIGFHEEQGNELLRRYIKKCNIASGDLIFVPLCGKTKDIAWLLSKGFKIVAVELNEDAVQQLFAELGSLPQIEVMQDFTRYYSRDINVYVGDFFAINETILGKVDLIYDRAALVALPPPMRERYTQHITDISHGAPQLLICFQYDQELLKGPPFSVQDELVNLYYNQKYHIKSLYRDYVKGGLRGQAEVFESVYMLTAIDE